MRNILFLFLLSAFTGIEVAAQPPGSPYDAELTTYPYPYPVTFHNIVSQGEGLKMAYLEVVPNSANGKTVLLLHGKNFNAAYWERTIRDLAAGGFRVIAPDQIGFGKSSKPHHYQFSFHQLAENSHNLLTALGVSRVSVVGHSMGGMLATRFALMYPDTTDRLVLVNPIGLEDYRIGVPYKSVDAWFADELRATPESIRAYQEQNYFGGVWKSEYNSLIDAPAGWTRHSDYPRVAWCSALVYDMIVTQPVVYEFSKVRAPTLLIIGTRDRTAIGKAFAPPAVAATLGDYGELGKKTARAIPGAKLVEIQEAGHMPQVETYNIYYHALSSFLMESP
ncbi:MAG: alpha/beta hydrolase [Candidatus Hydrogenedentes bacterium]|nr:alpha/beta hydrolase [Candidatus Hydrogenedentota bacterium]